MDERRKKMTNELINIDDVLKLPEIYEKVKNLPAKDLTEQYGWFTEGKIIFWASNCLLSFALHKQGYTFEEIQQLILNNSQSPMYISIPTLSREAWIYENILSKAPYLLKDNFLTKSHYKRMSQYKSQISDPIKELNYIASRKEEESIKHKKYSIRNWEEERGFGTLQKKDYVCDICGKKIKKYFKICKKCRERLDF